MLTPLHSTYCLVGLLLCLSGDAALGLLTLGGVAGCLALDTWWRKPPFHVLAVLAAPVGAQARYAVESTVADLAHRHGLTYEQLGYLLEDMGRRLRSSETEQ